MSAQYHFRERIRRRPDFLRARTRDENKSASTGNLREKVLGRILSSISEASNSILIDTRNPLSDRVVRKGRIAALLLLLQSGARWLSSHLCICG